MFDYAESRFGGRCYLDAGGVHVVTIPRYWVGGGYGGTLRYHVPVSLGLLPSLHLAYTTALTFPFCSLPHILLLRFYMRSPRCLPLHVYVLPTFEFVTVPLFVTDFTTPTPLFPALIWCDSGGHIYTSGSHSRFYLRFLHPALYLPPPYVYLHTLPLTIFVAYDFTIWVNLRLPLRSLHFDVAVRLRYYVVILRYHFVIDSHGC